MTDDISPTPSEQVSLARLAFQAAAAWDRYIQSDERPRPLSLWTQAATINDQLLLASKEALGLLPVSTPEIAAASNRPCTWCRDPIDADGGFCQRSIDGLHQ